MLDTVLSEEADHYPVCDSLDCRRRMCWKSGTLTSNFKKRWNDQFSPHSTLVNSVLGPYVCSEHTVDW